MACFRTNNSNLIQIILIKNVVYNNQTRFDTIKVRDHNWTVLRQLSSSMSPHETIWQADISLILLYSRATASLPCQRCLWIVEYKHLEGGFSLLWFDDVIKTNDHRWLLCLLKLLHWKCLFIIVLKPPHNICSALREEIPLVSSSSLLVSDWFIKLYLKWVSTNKYTDFCYLTTLLINKTFFKCLFYSTKKKCFSIST